MLPEEEHEAAKSIGLNLITLQSIAEEFRRCAHLYLFAHGRKFLLQNADRTQELEMIGLMRIAGRNGAVVASGFARIIEAINSTRAPVIWARADMAKRRGATKLFAKEFPSIDAIRTSAAHPGELMKKPEETEKHRLKQSLNHPAIKADNAPLYIEGMLHARADALGFGATVEGQFREYELSLSKADILEAVANRYCETFYPLEDPKRASGAQYIREMEARHQQDQRSRPPWWHSLLLR